MDYRELIEGAYGLHVHSAPDVLPRRMDDIGMAQWTEGSGMAGYAVKSHYLYISERAEPINKSYPDRDAVSTITLDSFMGGINPTAMEMAARSGAKLIWFPICDPAHEIAHVFDGNPDKKLPYWAQITIRVKEAGIQAPATHILREGGTLKKSVMDVLDIIAKYDMILAVGYASHGETFALVKEAKNRGAKKVVATHVDLPTTYYTMEEQKRFVEVGVMMEHCYAAWATGKVEFEVTKEMIRETGPANCILATDLGQKTALYPDGGPLEFAERLYDDSFTTEEVRTMTADNPRASLGK